MLLHFHPHAALIRRLIPFCLLSMLLWGSLRAALPVFAAPSDLDPSFGGAGLVSLSAGPHDSVHALAVQSDGKIIAAGFAGTPPVIDFTIFRLNSDGSLDAGFGSGGLVTVDIADEDAVLDLAVQPDGKILASGQTRIAYDYQFAVLRLNADGSLDSSFGSGGKVTTNIGSLNAGREMVLQPDGRIVVVGQFGSGVSQDFGLVRYNADGSLDTSFGTGGVVSTNINGSDGAFSLALQGDGKLVAVGVAGSDIAVARYNSDGSLDTGFGTGGKVTTNVTTYDAGTSVVVQDDGRIAVGGVTGSGSAGDFVLVRYNADGTLDGSFGGGGIVTADSGLNDAGYGIALQANGKLVLAGYSTTADAIDADTALVRYNTDGSPDTDFDGDGMLITDTGGRDFAWCVTIQPDGKIIAGSDHYNTPPSTDIALTRYLGDPTQVTAALPSSADTYLRQGANDTNEGGSTFLRLQSSGNNRALVRFDQAEIEALVGGGTVLTATLQMTITHNGDNWGSSGRTVDVHRLTRDWAEGNGFVDGNQPPNRGSGSGATWNCAVDSNIANQARDCSGTTEWEMARPDHPELHPWVEAPTATVSIQNGQSGVVAWDVTADVADFLAGDATNYGWIIRKTLEGQAGHVEFGSKQSADGPRLVITWQ